MSKTNKLKLWLSQKGTRKRGKCLKKGFPNKVGGRKGNWN